MVRENNDMRDNVGTIARTVKELMTQVTGLVHAMPRPAKDLPTPPASGSSGGALTAAIILGILAVLLLGLVVVQWRALKKHERTKLF